MSSVQPSPMIKSLTWQELILMQNSKMIQHRTDNSASYIANNEVTQLMTKGADTLKAVTDSRRVL